MNNLDDRRDIQTCREHHASIEQLLARFPPLRDRDASGSADQLNRLRTILLRHLKFEDDQLYPRLLRSDQPDVVAMAVRYQTEMGGLAAACVAFFTRWPEAETIAASFDVFAAEWTGVRGALERRILAEDTELYEMADRV
jgi:hypothetical protein